MKIIKLKWKGEDLTINENEAFEIGEQIEEIISLNEIALMATAPKFRKLARCYAEMINFAGGHATPQEIHSEMMDQIKEGGEDAQALLVATALEMLVEILMDGAPTGDGGEGKKMPSSSKPAT
mgnify:CR=1 FL=1